MSADATLLWMLVEHLLLTGLPAALGVFVAMRRGLSGVPLLLGVALAASGLTAMLAFWAYYADPTLGQATAFLIVLGSIQGIVMARPDRLDRELLRELAVPAALWALGSAFVLYLGFLHGGGDQPLALATIRFSHPLPTDNDIPRFFADWYYHHGHHGPPPPFGDWLSSDRPPLQSGYVLAQRPFGWDDSGRHYQVLGVVVQQLWILGMWAVLCAARIRPFVRGLAIFALMVSDIAIVHGFFVWPKLIAAAFVLAAFAIVLSEDWRRLRHSPFVAVLFAALCALAMLAHGASAFGLIPLLIVGAVRGLPDWRWLGIAALVGIVLLAPWSAYQRLADPPGDRLLKWQLGGSLEIDDRGALETIGDGYRTAGFDGTLENKWGNVTKLVGQKDVEGAVERAVEEIGEGHPGRAVEALRLPRFFSLLPLVGFLLIGPLAMLFARARGRPDGPEWRFALLCFAFCGLACAIWALLMFGEPDSSTLLHVGSLVVPLLAICACVVGAYSVYPRLSIALVALNAIFALALYVPALSPPPGTSYSVVAALIAAASLAGFVWVAFRHGHQHPAKASA
ncbi:MAG TPA: hypothetical protein VFM94_11435 [Solirubrobacterales bacterium]|nr:hypothetical protein [Solirubrobacterales bacterium]